jgi:hypothetical protein
MPPLPDPHAIAVLLLVLGAFWLFTRDGIRFFEPLGELVGVMS